MKVSPATWTMVGVISAVVIGIYWLSRRKSSPSRGGLFTKSLEAFQTAESSGSANASIQELVGNPEVCKMMKNLLTTVTGNLANAQTLNNPAQVQLLEVSKRGIEAQIVNLKCA